MGLFSTKIKTVVNTVASRVIKDEMLPNSARTGVIKAILNGGNVPEYVMEELVASIGLKADRMYKYGQDHYTHGLPSGQIKTALEGRPEVEAVLATLEGAPVLLDYCHYSPPNLQHTGWIKVIADHGYNPATNQLAALTLEKGTPVYLKDMQVVVPSLEAYEAGALEQWGSPATAGYTPERTLTGLIQQLRAATPVLVDPEAAAAHIRVDYVWEGEEVLGELPVLSSGSFDIALTGYLTEADYFHAKYTVGGVTKFWMYQDDLGTYPTLDAVFATTASVNGTFFPFAYFRYNKTSEITDKTTQAYLTSRKLVKYLGMDYDQVAEAIDENPDIADVEQAMMIMAVPANTTVECERKYLFQFFDTLFYADANQFASPIRAGIARHQWAGQDIDKSSLIIQDARFKMALSNGGIYKKRVVGNIGEIGSHDSGTGDLLVDQEYIAGEGLLQTMQVPIKYHYYRKQISANLYDELQVVNLKVLYHILAGYAVTADELDDILLIPLDRSITETLSVIDREELYARSLHFVFNSVQLIKIKWYQQMWFQFVMAIVAVVLTVLSLGSATGPLATLMAATTTAAAQAAIMALLTQILQGLVIGLVLKLFVQAVGGEVALVLAVIVAAYTFSQMMFNGLSLQGVPWASELLQLSNGLAKSVSAFYTKEMQNLVGDYTASLDLQKQLTDELNTAQKLLENDNYLSPFVIFGEKPNEFYNRTIHSGNIGVLSIGAISKYVDIALRLPSLDDTLGDRAYV